MKSAAPEGWAEILAGPCIHIEVVAAALEAQGFRAVIRRFSDQALWSGTFMEQCRVYVPSEQAEQAQAVVRDAEPAP